MHKSTTYTSGRTYSHNYHASRPFFTAPRILSIYKENGIRMYECTGKRHFIAAVYDKMFTPTKTAMRPAGFKGENVNVKLRT